jgi:DHA2 family multidrug resistance protein-like MFS transporter
VVTLATDVIVGSVAPEHAGQASGLSETATELGGALGIALLGSVAAAVYRSHAHLPVGVGHVRTLAGAVHAAEHLPEPLRAPLLDASRLAFTQSLHVVAIIGAILAALLAVLVARMLRGAGRDVGEDGRAGAGAVLDQALPRLCLELLDGADDVVTQRWSDSMTPSIEMRIPCS